MQYYSKAKKIRVEAEFDMKQRDLKEAKGFNTTNSTIYLEEYLEENLLKSKALLEFEAVKETRQERIPAMVILGIDRDALSTRGLNKVSIATYFIQYSYTYSPLYFILFISVSFHPSSLLL